jgi:hypothetical protein
MRKGLSSGTHPVPEQREPRARWTLIAGGLWLAALAGSLGMSGCGSSENSSTGGHSSDGNMGGNATGGSNGGTSAGGTSTGGTSTGGTSTGGSGGAGAGGTSTGGGAPGSDCPTGAFPNDKHVVYGDDFGGATLDADTVWTKDNLYIVKGDLQIKAALTIQAGTTVCLEYNMFDERGALVVGKDANAKLDIQGTDAEHVVLTSTSSDKFWGGVRAIDPLKSFSIAYTDVFNASTGADSGDQDVAYGAIRTQENSQDGALPPVRLHHVSFHNLRYGCALHLAHKSGLTADSVVEVQSFAPPQGGGVEPDPAVMMWPEGMDTLAPGMIQLAADLPADKRGVQPIVKGFEKSVTWHGLDIPYLVSGGFYVLPSLFAQQPPTLTIEAGAEIRLAPANSLEVGGNVDQGNLVVKGAAGKPVRFLPLVDSGKPEDDWGGIEFLYYDPAVSSIEYAELVHGGDSLESVPIACKASSSRGLVVLRAPEIGGSSYAGIPIKNTTFDTAYDNGIVAECDPPTCIDAAADYLDPASGNVFKNIPGKKQILSTCPP